FAEALVALALDELEEHRAQQPLRKDLQKEPSLAAFGRSIEQNAARLQLSRVLSVTGEPLVEHLVIGRRRRRHQLHAGPPQTINARQQIVGEERDVLDA